MTTLDELYAKISDLSSARDNSRELAKLAFDERDKWKADHALAVERLVATRRELEEAYRTMGIIA